MRVLTRNLRRATFIVLVTVLELAAPLSRFGFAQEKPEFNRVANPARGLGAQSPRPIAIVHATVIDATGAPPQTDMTVVIVGDRITQLGKAAVVEIPPQAQVLDAKGKFLIPGLCDMHVHLSWTGPSALPVLVANGVTRVRDMGGILAEIDEWRAGIAAGTLAGPAIVRAGPALNGKEFAFHQLAVTSDAEARAAVRTLHKVGVDFIKIHRALSREAYFALIEEARRLQIPVAGHVPTTVSPAEASDAGQASLEHTETLFEGTFSAQMTNVREELLEAIIRFKQTDAGTLFARFARNGTAFTPTLVAYRRSAEPPEAWTNDPRDRFVSSRSRRLSRDNVTPAPATVLAARKRVFAEFVELVGLMNRNGVTLLAGTDLATIGIYPGFSLHDELALLVEAGLTPMQALQAATRNPAKFLGRLEQLGTIEAGKVADLVLLDANPLEDIRNTQKIRAMILNGRLLNRRELDKLLTEAAASAKTH
jgi:imidazolonepropionase-like amidohydrolase